MTFLLIASPKKQRLAKARNSSPRVEKEISFSFSAFPVAIFRGKKAHTQNRNRVRVRGNFLKYADGFVIAILTNKAGYMGKLATCGWAGAVIKKVSWFLNIGPKELLKLGSAPN